MLKPIKPTLNFIRRKPVLSVFIFLMVLVVGSIELNYRYHSYIRANPYKAKTAEECIDEKECVWHVFQKVVLARPLITEQKDRWVSKWGNDISVRLIKGRAYEDRVQKVIDRLSGYFPYEINIEEPPSMNIVFSSDYNETFYGHLAKDLIETAGFSDEIYNLFAKIPEDSGCFDFSRTVKETYNTGLVVSVIDENSDRLDACIYLVFFWSLGFEAKESDVKFSFLNRNGKLGEPTVLDLFLVKLLYQQDFYPTMPRSDIEQAFDRAYKKTIQNYHGQD